MVMPVLQRCPTCGTDFMGSDSVGRPCMGCVLEEAARMREIPHEFDDRPFGFGGCKLCGVTKEEHQ